MDTITLTQLSRRTALKGLGLGGAALSTSFAGRLAAQDASDQVTIAVGADISTLDPHLESTTNFSQLLQSYENLIEIDANLKVQPALATSWEMADDTTWLFHLRENVKFHNGETMTAEDVAWNLNRILASDATSGPRKSYVVWLESAEVVDELTVQLNTLAPYSSVVVANYIPIMIPKAYFEEVGPDGFVEAPVGTGPYKIDEWKVNESLTLTAFDDYWGGPPPIPNATFRIIPEESTRVNEIQTGGVDIVLNLSPYRVTDLDGNADIEISSKPSVLNFYLGFNTTADPFQDVKVREAIAHAIDVPLMVETLLAGYGQVANSLVHSTSFGWMESLEPFAYDPDLAKQLLSEAGFPDGFSATFYGGPDLWPVTDETGQAISGFLADVGIDAPFELLDWGDYFDRYRNSELDGLFLWGNSSPGLEASTHLTLNFLSPPVGRGLYWSSPETDELIVAANEELDPDARQELYFQIQQILHDQVAAAPLWNYEEVAAVGPRIDWEARGDFYVRAKDVLPA
jgi:peptide/nickel transport system substrate-binding protein